MPKKKRIKNYTVPMQVITRLTNRKQHLRTCVNYSPIFVSRFLPVFLLGLSAEKNTKNKQQQINEKDDRKDLLYIVTLCFSIHHFKKKVSFPFLSLIGQISDLGRKTINYTILAYSYSVFKNYCWMRSFHTIRTFQYLSGGFLPF